MPGKEAVSVRQRSPVPVGRVKRTPRRLAQFCRRAIAGVAVLVFIASAGCGGQLRPVQHAELHALSETSRPQGNSPSVREDYRGLVTDKAQWRAYFSSGDATPAVDGQPDTAALTPPEHGSDLWLLVDLGDTGRFQSVRQIHPDAAGPPKRYRIDVANQRGFPFKLVWAGAGQSPESLAVFRRPVEARFLRITVLEESSTRWGLSELDLF